MIKRKRVVAAEGHHGGAWKVAYADFVTAMMAFFLMLWLLGSVEDDKRKGLADYFSQTLAVQSDSAGGDGVFGGESLSERASITDMIATRERYDSSLAMLAPVFDFLDAARLDLLTYGEALDHIALRVTDEGLVIEVFDLEDRALFTADNLPHPVLARIVELVAQALATIANPIAIDAHARSFPAVFREDLAWPMTLARADIMKTLLEAEGLPQPRIHRVAGHADRNPHVSPTTAARNNRIELIARFTE